MAPLYNPFAQTGEPYIYFLDIHIKKMVYIKLVTAKCTHGITTAKTNKEPKRSKKSEPGFPAGLAFKQESLSLIIKNL
ncbi:hypothetical protein HMPREF1981_03016 [Bacteroides pyogenes F0041]|uniref:Uncharacterized protein n=1 Tax=Bacteroides pyogenes F0041 TaxID=1321819 RepID=U2DJE5_9BACE|nr:hypothetical protein HMPREF1981_03016 [Bacteroides pyogenes F0041]GAE20859.1 hypothetical protein JCM10003_242 [Bacteroides pyogenes JCM 10003]